MSKLTVFQKGQKINGSRLNPLEVLPGANGGFDYRCKCDCGKETTVSHYDLKNGRTKSCGCYKLDMFDASRTTHGLSKLPEYYAAFNAFARCTNKSHESYSSYGKRGIKVRFESVEVMARWLIKNLPKPKVGRTLLDRINNDGHYEPGNLKWSTSMESANNRGVCRMITIGGITKTATMWARESGISAPGLIHRIENGFPESLWLFKGKIPIWMRAQVEFELKNGSKPGS